MPVQRCTVHKHRNLLAHAPDGCTRKSLRLQRYDYAGSKTEIEAKRKAFIRKWRPKCRAVANSLEEAGDKLFTSRVSRKASGNRSGHRMQLNVCTKSSSGESRPKPCCPRGNRGDVVLGFAGFWSDHDAQGGRLAKPQRKAIRSDD